MKLNLDSVVSNLLAVLLECSGTEDRENVFSVLAEAGESLHLAGEQQRQFRDLGMKGGCLR